MRPADPDRIVRDVGRRVGELRAAASLTQEKLAALAEVSLKYLQRVESGEENLTIRSLVRLANLLGVPVASLLEAPTSQRPRVGRPPKTKSP